MKKYWVCLALLILLSGQVRSISGFHSQNTQSNEPSEASKCPTINIEGPPHLDRLDDTYDITVKVEGMESDQTLSYQWHISSGEIKSGQGTATITVKLPDLHKETFTADVEIGGLPNGCSNKVSYTMAI